MGANGKFVKLDDLKQDRREWEYLVNYSHPMGTSIVVDSAGTGDWHLGESPDARSKLAALTRGYDISKLTARQVANEDFSEFDYLLAIM